MSGSACIACGASLLRVGISSFWLGAGLETQKGPYCASCFPKLTGEPLSKRFEPLIMSTFHIDEASSKQGVKHDAGKLPSIVSPLRALQEVAKVLEFGSRKYEWEGWRGVKPRRYLAAALRHLFDRAMGQKIDPESGLPTLAHAACDVLFLLSFDVGTDPEDMLEEDENQGRRI